MGLDSYCLCEQWYQLVERYAELDLTYIHKGRLVALASIANEFGRAILVAQREREEAQVQQHRDAEEARPIQDKLSLCYGSGL